MAEIRLSQADIDKARSVGTLSFRTLRARRFRCNQLPHLGALNESQKDGLWTRIWPRNNTVKATTCTAHRVSDGWFKCPMATCGHWNRPTKSSLVNCGSCGTELHVI